MIWIRTQNRKDLVLVERLSIELYTDELRFVIVSLSYNDKLGIYKTREMAMKVLDQIQEFIYNQECDRLYSNNYDISYGATAVFEMPDDEVEL